jgi:hypothetical protein
MNASTGAAIDGDAHLVQSIQDILSTPIGTRVRRRDYGSLLFELIDAPFNAATRMLMYAATALALGRWEPRIRLTRVGIELGEEPGAIRLEIEGERTDRPEPNSFTRLTFPLRLRTQPVA